jgi:hypothetical protein
MLSRSSMSFASRPGRPPRAQSVTIRSEGGGVRSWSASSDAPWLKLSTNQGVTPARLFIQLDPAPDNGEALVTFRDELGGTATLAVSVQPASLTATGDGCALLDGTLHVNAGAGCALATRDSSRWTLPDGRELTGERLYAQFVRRGTFQMLIGERDVADPLTVVIE